MSHYLDNIKTSFFYYYFESGQVSDQGASIPSLRCHQLVCFSPPSRVNDGA